MRGTKFGVRWEILGSRLSTTKCSSDGASCAVHATCKSIILESRCRASASLGPLDAVADGIRT